MSEKLTVRDKKTPIWEWVDEHHPEWWETVGQPDSPLADHEVHLMLTKLATNALGGAKRVKLTYLDIERWLSNPDHESPYVDEVAVERALGFDWDAIRRLTRHEREEFYDRLAASSDPWGFYESEFGKDMSPKSVSPLWSAWMNGSETERRSIRRGIERRRAQAQAQAVAA